uniref:Uncharacterized protein n=1 Tax=Panagrolaimus sp. ES5 TaxID=591445 RepID=A0AC34G834_9BILA
MNQTKKIERANSISGTAPSSSLKSPRLQAIDQRISRLSFENDGDDDSILSRRKVSLMPLVTEEDLKKNTDLGRKDPEGIAQVFGDDVASRFRYPSTPSSAISPPPYDTKEKMVLRKISPLITPPLPHETRDLHAPRGVPTVKVRKRRSLTIFDGSLNEATTSTTVFEDVSVALSPVFAHNIVTNYGNTNCFFGTSLDVPGPWQKIGKYNFAIKDYEQFAIDIAASNPDMVHFQQVLNQWVGLFL